MEGLWYWQRSFTSIRLADDQVQRVKDSFTLAVMAEKAELIYLGPLTEKPTVASPACLQSESSKISHTENWGTLECVTGMGRNCKASHGQGFPRCHFLYLLWVKQVSKAVQIQGERN